MSATIQEGLRTLFLAEGTINTLIGGASGRCHVNGAPQNTPTPYLLITRTDEDAYVDLGGTDDLHSADIDVDAYGATPAKAAALADAVFDFFHNKTGAAGDQTVKAVIFDGRSDQDIPKAGKEIAKFLDSLSFQVQYL